MVEHELLDAIKIKSAISKQGLLLLSKLDIFDSIDSTNTYLLQQAKSGGISGSVCLAEEQTQGRGRRGRFWVSPRGANIYCSVLWDFALQDFSALSLAVGVIVTRFFQKQNISNQIRLKWPNDLVYRNRKLGGILLEKSGNFIVIGIGLNVNLSEHVAHELKISAIDLNALMSARINRNRLVGLLINELLLNLSLFAQRGFKAFIEDWCCYDALIGQAIVIRTPRAVFSGIMQGVSEQGELLLLDIENQVHRFCYGEVTVERECQV